MFIVKHIDTEGEEMMGFNDIIWHRVIVESLRNAVKSNMISNGYVFSGPKGCGKKLMAFIFAMALANPAL